MRKEVIFAIIFGVSLGLVVVFGIFRMNSTINNTDRNSLTKTTEKDTVSSSDNSYASLSLLKPSNKEVFSENPINISGVTKPTSYIVATGGISDIVVESASDGTFNFSYEIQPSVNYLVVNSITKTNERSQSKLAVAYSSELNQTQDLTTDTEGKVENKLEITDTKWEFYDGIITDLTDSGLQLKNSDGEIKQVSLVKDLTSYAKIGTTNSKISLSDIAIGDYIVSLGLKKNNDLLEAARILVTKEVAYQDVKIFYGNVKEKNKTDMVVSESSANDIVIVIDNYSKTFSGDLKNPDRSRFANIKTGDLVIGTYATDEEDNVARRIYILDSGKEE